MVFSLENSGLTYEAGDALGVRPVNCPEVVEAVLARLPFASDDDVALPDGGRATLREALLRHCEIRHLLTTPPPEAASAAEFVAGLRRMQPRLYSIASSPLAHPGEVHLCVGVVRYDSEGMRHKGVASTFLAERLSTGDSAGVFVQSAKHFRLPDDRNAPAIMVGPGTGIAPFRAFLEHREATGAGGRNWLFFGDRHAATDFLYREQLETWHRGGLLTRLDTAFSRDQDEKIYVQTLMLRQARDLWKWLEEGAHFYVCGDASRMARDVDAALHAIVQSEGGMTAEAAADYVAGMKKSKRYARDVY